MRPLLAIDGLTAGYGEIVILRDVALAVGEGSITALVGSNGAGKTTLMRALAGLIPAPAGTITFDGESIAARAPAERVARGLALVPEGRMIFPDLTVAENLRIGAFAARARDQRDRRMAEMYALFPRLAERAGQRGETLSGGEQQMLALARGLMASPRLLLLDEPSLGLAPMMAALVFATIRRIRDAGVTIFIVEQDVRTTLAIADHAYVLENGRIVQSGPAATLAADPAVKAAYLGL